MADITKIKLPNGDIYNVKDSVARAKADVYYVEGVSTDTAGNWTGTLDGLTEYYNGLTIIYVTKVAGVSGGSKLNINGLGAIPCKLTDKGAITTLTTHYPVGTPIPFTYVDGNFIHADYSRANDNTTDISVLNYGNGNYVADSALYRYQMLFQVDEDKLTPLNNVNNSTATTKTILTSVEFDPFGIVGYYTSTTNVAANGAIGAGSIRWAGAIDLRYSLNISSSVNALTAHKDIYIKVIPLANGKAKLAAAFPLVQSLPESPDGFWYIYFGRAYSTYQAGIRPHHPVYLCEGREVKKQSDLYYVEGPSTDTTAGTWTGTINGLTSYYNGLTIIYVPSIAGAATTTLNINGLGAKTCYITDITKLGTHFEVRTPILLTYVSGSWKRADYNSDTHRPIKVNGTQTLGDNTTALNLKNGANVSITASNGDVTIAATDTTYESKAAASGGTDVSLVTTGEKYTWNNKTSNTGTVTSVGTGVGLTGGSITTSGTIKANLRSETALTVDSAAGTLTSGKVYPVVPDKSGYLAVNVPWANDDTKNTAGSTDTSSKIFLIGATAQTASSQTYSQDTAYVGTDGCLYSNSTKVLTAHQDISGKANLASPTFTGTPAAPTATAGTDTTQIATTAFVNTAVTNAMNKQVHFYYVVGPSTDTTAGTWTGTIDGLTAYYDGLTILYVPAVAGGSSATTLNINGIGAKTCYYSNTSALTTHYSVGTPVLFTYRADAWRRADYNSNTTYSVFDALVHTNGAYVANSVIYRYQLLAQMDTNTLTPFNNVSNGYNKTTKSILTSVEFDPFGEIFYYATTGTISANASVPATYLCFARGAVDLRYSFNLSESVNPLTAALPVYMKVSPQLNGKVKLAADFPLVQTLPAAPDGYWYIFIGRAYSTYQTSLYPHRTVYACEGKIVDNNTFMLRGKAGMEWNAAEECIDFVFA